MEKFWTEQNVNLLIEYWNDGWTTNAIAAKIGGDCNKSMVSAYTQKNRDLFPQRIARKSMALLKADINELAAAWANDALSSDEIGKLFDLKGVEVREIAALNRDLFPPRSQASKKRYKAKTNPKSTPRVSTVWARRDPSSPAPDSYKPLPMDDYEIARLPHAKPFHDLERNECKWPLGEDRPYRFCACQTTQAGTYCAHHVVKAIGVGTKSEREATKVHRRAA